MARRRSFTSQLYRAARLSNNLRSVSRGPGSYARHVVRRKVYAKQSSVARSIFKALGLGR